MAALPDDATFATDGTTIVILAVPGGSVTHVFSSVASGDEQKFRRKVGEFHALNRYMDDPGAGMLLPGFWTATQILDGLETQCN